MYGGGSASKLTAGALAGVLAVGMIPAAAFAEDEAIEPADEAAIEEVAEEAAIELEAEEAPIELQASDKEAFEGGTVTAAIDQDGAPVDVSAITFTAGAAAQYAVPTEVTPAGTDTKPLVLSTAKLGGSSTANVGIDIIKDANKDGQFAKSEYTAANYLFTAQAVDGKNLSKSLATPGDINPVLASSLSAADLLAKLPAGKYLSVAWVVDGDSYRAVALPFEVVNSPLTGTTAFEIDSANPSDTSDTTFTYGTANLDNIGFALNGEDITSMVNVEVYPKDTIGTPTPLDAGDYLTAGDWVAKITGKAGNKYAGATVEVPVTVGKLDLATANIVMNDVESSSVAAPTIKTLDGKDAFASDLNTILTVTNIKNTTTNESILNATGHYTATLGLTTDNTVIAANAAAAASVTGTKAIEFDLTGDSLTNEMVFYTGEAKKDVKTASAYTVNLAAKEDKGTVLKEFLFSKVAVEIPVGTALKTSQYEITVADKDGNAVSGGEAALKTPGEYTVTVKLKPETLDTPYSYGGSQSFKVSVVNEALGDANVFYTVDGTNVAKDGTATLEYDGTDQASKIAVKVQDSKKKELTAGTDYTVTIKKAGKEVTEVKDAGDYVVSVKAPAYGIAEQSITVTVDTLKLRAIRIADTKLYDVNKVTTEFIEYTGKAITPVVEYRTGWVVDAETPSNSAFEKTAGKYAYETLPAEAYKLVYKYSADGKAAYKAVSEIKDEGFYQISIQLNSPVTNWEWGTNGANIWLNDTTDDEDQAPKAEVAQLNGNPVTIQVLNARLFEDVKDDSWYRDVVYKADELGYMNGYKGTNLFKPNNNLTRAEAATVIWKMAGNKMAAGSEDTTGGADAATIETGFSDVDGKAWYAEPIKWAVDAGVVKGYTSGANAGKFLPNAPVTREEFMVMISRYAKEVAGKDTTSDGKAMASKKDPQKVSSWAKDAVAWGVDGDMIGSNGTINPQGKITRAEVAKITTVYQPAPLTTVEKL